MVVVQPSVTTTASTTVTSRSSTTVEAPPVKSNSTSKSSNNSSKLEMPDKPPVTTVFVGNISERAPDVMISQMLSRCGNVLSWKRVQGASGKLQAFGFCEYEDPEATLRCIRLLNNWQIADKRLVVKVDPKTDALLSEYKRKKRGKRLAYKEGREPKRRRKEEKEEGEAADEDKDEEKEEGEEAEEKEEGEEEDEEEEILDDKTRGEDRLVKHSLDSLMREFSHDLLKATTVVHDDKPRKSEPEKRLEMMHRKRDRLEGPRHLTIEDMDLDSEKIDLINREIESFRNRHKDEDPQQEDEREREHRERRRRELLVERERAERERERIRAATAAASSSRAESSSSRAPVPPESSSSRRSRRSRSRSSSPPPRPRSGRGLGSERSGGGGSGVGGGYDDEEEEYERKRLERKLREKESAYQERLKNWASRERKKQKEYEREREKEDERTAEEAREARRLREFLEDYDDEQDDPKFYKGASLLKRMKEREREREADDRDKRKEFEEMEAAKRRLLEDPNRDPNDTELLITQMEASISGHLRKRLRMVDLENLPTVESVVEANEPSSGGLPSVSAVVSSHREGASVDANAESPSRGAPMEEDREGQRPAESGSDDGAVSPSRSVDSSASPVNPNNNGETGMDEERDGVQQTPVAGVEENSHDHASESQISEKKTEESSHSVAGEPAAPGTDGVVQSSTKSLLEPHELPPAPEEQPGLSPAERKRQFVRRLIERIPTQKDELFAFVIDWSMVDEAFVERRIKPWINKKIVEYLGELEPSLSQFICQKVVGHSAPQEILNDIAMKLTKCLLFQLVPARAWLQTFGGGCVLLERSKDYGIITLENKGKLNSLTGKMMTDFEVAVSDLEKSPPRGVILRGDSGVFCTGFDLNFVHQVASPRHAETLCAFMQNITHRLRSLPCPSVALIEGHAIGGGAELAVCCDWRAIHPKSRIEFRQSRIGVTTGWGGGPRLVQLVGSSNALQLLLSSQRIGIHEATQLGLADFVIPEATDDNLRTVLAWLESMYGDVATETVHAMKKLVTGVDIFSRDSTFISKEREVFESVWGRTMQQQIIEKLALKKKK